MKDAAKKIGKQFACGSSVSKAASGAEEVVIQGDVLMDLPSFLETTFNVRGITLWTGNVGSRKQRRRVRCFLYCSRSQKKQAKSVGQ